MFQNESDEHIREAVVATFKSYRLSCCSDVHHSVNQLNFCLNLATDKLDHAAETVKTLNGDSADIYKVGVVACEQSC